MPEFFTSRNGVLTVPTGEAFTQAPSKTLPSYTFVSASSASAIGAATTTISGIGASAGDVVLMLVTSIYDPKMGAYQTLPTGFTSLAFAQGGYDWLSVLGVRTATGTETSYTTTAGWSVFSSVVTTVVQRGVTTVVAVEGRGHSPSSYESLLVPQTSGGLNTARDTGQRIVFMTHRASTDAITAPSNLVSRFASSVGDFFAVSATGERSNNGVAPLYVCGGTPATLQGWVVGAVMLT